MYCSGAGGMMVSLASLPGGPAVLIVVARLLSHFSQRAVLPAATTFRDHRLFDERSRLDTAVALALPTGAVSLTGRDALMAAGLSACLGGLVDLKGCFETSLERFRNSGWSWLCGWRVWLARFAGFALAFVTGLALARGTLAARHGLHRIVSRPGGIGAALRPQVVSGCSLLSNAAAVGIIVRGGGRGLVCFDR